MEKERAHAHVADLTGLIKRELDVSGLLPEIRRLVEQDAAEIIKKISGMQIADEKKVQLALFLAADSHSLGVFGPPGGVELEQVGRARELSGIVQKTAEKRLPEQLRLLGDLLFFGQELIRKLETRALELVKVNIAPATPTSISLAIAAINVAAVEEGIRLHHDIIGAFVSSRTLQDLSRLLAEAAGVNYRELSEEGGFHAIARVRLEMMRLEISSKHGFDTDKITAIHHEAVELFKTLVEKEEIPALDASNVNAAAEALFYVASCLQGYRLAHMRNRWVDQMARGLGYTPEKLDVAPAAEPVS